MSHPEAGSDQGTAPHMPIDSPPDPALGSTKPGVENASLDENKINNTGAVPNSDAGTREASAAEPGVPSNADVSSNPPTTSAAPAPSHQQTPVIPAIGESVTVRASANCTVAQPFQPGPSHASDPYAGKTIYDFQVLDCNHELYNLEQHRGEVLLICNVASKCKEYSGQGYKTLVELYKRYHNRGFTVIAVPCNQFGGAEPGNEEDIAEDVPMLYSGVGEIEFPIMAKVDVNGDHELPLYAFLKARVKGTLGQSAIKWNFTSFLIDKEGNPLVRFAPGATLEEIEPRVQEALNGTPLGSVAAAPALKTREPSGEELGKATPAPADPSPATTP